MDAAEVVAFVSVPDSATAVTAWMCENGDQHATYDDADDGGVCHVTATADSEMMRSLRMPYHRTVAAVAVDTVLHLAEFHCSHSCRTHCACPS